MINADVVRWADVTHEEMSEVEKREQAEVSRRARRFRGDRAPIDLAGRTVIEVTCLETPSTLRATGSWCTDFTQNTDEQVVEPLQRAARSMSR
ncbi:hypothetical protein ACWEPL_55655 [Nonomuraea sp. NPDC004186]